MSDSGGGERRDGAVPAQFEPSFIFSFLTCCFGDEPHLKGKGHDVHGLEKEIEQRVTTFFFIVKLPRDTKNPFSLETKLLNNDPLLKPNNIVGAKVIWKIPSIFLAITFQ